MHLNFIYIMKEQESETQFFNNTCHNTSPFCVRYSLEHFKINITRWFSSVDPVWVDNAGDGKDVCSEKETSWNHGEFIHDGGNRESNGTFIKAPVPLPWTCQRNSHGYLLSRLARTCCWIADSWTVQSLPSLDVVEPNTRRTSWVCSSPYFITPPRHPGTSTPTKPEVQRAERYLFLINGGSISKTHTIHSRIKVDLLPGEASGDFSTIRRPVMLASESSFEALNLFEK